MEDTTPPVCTTGVCTRATACRQVGSSTWDSVQFSLGGSKPTKPGGPKVLIVRIVEGREGGRDKQRRKDSKKLAFLLCDAENQSHVSVQFVSVWPLHNLCLESEEV